jgi:hypothetical protein
MPSWCGAQLKKSTGTLPLPYLMDVNRLLPNRKKIFIIISFFKAKIIKVSLCGVEAVKFNTK